MNYTFVTTSGPVQLADKLWMEIKIHFLGEKYVFIEIHWMICALFDEGVLPITVYPKRYAHGFCFAVLCCGYTLTDFPISIRLTSLALWQSNDCPSASNATLMNMDKYFMWIHYERLHNHNKVKHNKTVCIFLGIYCILYSWTGSGPLYYFRKSAVFIALQAMFICWNYQVVAVLSFYRLIWGHVLFSLNIIRLVSTIIIILMHSLRPRDAFMHGTRNRLLF